MATGLVLEASVVAVEDDLLGNKMIALVTPINETIDAMQINASCSQMLPQHMVPTDVLLVRSLPKNKSGKVDTRVCEKIALNIVKI